MGVFEAIVVFVISWWVVFLPSLSVGTRSQHEAGAVVPGSERGAPEKISWRPKILFTTAAAALITFLIGLALNLGWLAFMFRAD